VCVQAVSGTVIAHYLHSFISPHFGCQTVNTAGGRVYTDTYWMHSAITAV